MTQNLDRLNRGQLAPGVGDITNHWTSNFIEAQVARPRDVRDRARRSHEELRAEEGLRWQPEYATAFAQGTTPVGERHYETRAAGQAAGRSKLGRGQMVPAWSTVDSAYFDSFGSASSGDQGPGSPPPFAKRAGSANPNTLAPLDGLARGERPSSIVVRQQAVPGRRRNEAEVRD